MAEEDNQEKEIVERLDTIIRLLVDFHPQLQEEQTTRDKIDKLIELGLSNKIISEIVGRTPHYVAVVRSQLKKAKKSTKKPK